MNAFTQQQLRQMAEACALRIAQARTDVEYSDGPYKHSVIDNFLDRDLAILCLERFPAIDDACWERADDADIEVKLRTTWKSEFHIPDTIVHAAFNRLVIFDSHDFNFHGLPEPLAFPAGTARRSIILYCYTMAQRPSGQVAITGPHSALWMKRRMHDKRVNKTRAYK